MKWIKNLFNRKEKSSPGDSLEFFRTITAGRLCADCGQIKHEVAGPLFLHLEQPETMGAGFRLLIRSCVECGLTKFYFNKRYEINDQILD